MTTTTASNSDQAADFSLRVGLLGCEWLPHHQIRLPVDDLGFRQGVTVVERLRTYRKRIFAVDAHLDRWQHSVSELSIGGLPSRSEIESLLEELLRRNQTLIETEGDVGITMFATPGMPSTTESNSPPTFGMHLNRLNAELGRRRRELGQPLVVSDIQQPDSSCWPRSIKVRSRLHYFLADLRAKQLGDDTSAVLVDGDGAITETSIANVAIVREGEVVSPPGDRVLGGVTQSVVESLASQDSLGWSKRPISADDLARADEVLLMGTDTGLWFANSVGGRPVGTGNPGPVYLSLLRRFDHLVDAGDE